MKKKITETQRLFLILILFCLYWIGIGMKYFFTSSVINDKYLLVLLLFILLFLLLHMVRFVIRNFRTYQFKRSFALSIVLSLIFTVNITVAVNIFNVLNLTCKSILLLFALLVLFFGFVFFIKKNSRNIYRSTF